MRKVTMLVGLTVLFMFVMNHLELQRRVLLSGERDEFLATLAARQKKVLRILNRKTGIQIGGRPICDVQRQGRPEDLLPEQAGE